MGLKELLVGKPSGQTAWQKMRNKFAPENLEKNNILNIQLGSVIEIQRDKIHSFRCESIIRYLSPENTEAWLRFCIKDMLSGEVFFLEAMPDSNESYFYTLFKLIDEIQWDKDLIDVITNEDILRHSEDNRALDYEKDFILNCLLEIYINNNKIYKNIFSANYVCRHEDSTETYLSVEANHDEDRIAFFIGEKLSVTNINVY